MAEYDPETASIKGQIENTRKTLNQIEPVVSLAVPQNLKSKLEASRWAIEILKPTGYQVERKDYGTIFFSKKDIDKGLRYADRVEERAAIAARPNVLKRGIDIGTHQDHKGRGKQTVTFAAPVILNGKRGNMAVVVNERGHHYYAHRIVLPNGKTFPFSETNNDATQELSRGVTVSGSLADTTSVASMNSIPNPAEKVKGFDSPCRRGVPEGTRSRAPEYIGNEGTLQI